VLLQGFIFLLGVPGFEPPSLLTKRSHFWPPGGNIINKAEQSLLESRSRRGKVLLFIMASTERAFTEHKSTERKRDTRFPGSDNFNNITKDLAVQRDRESEVTKRPEMFKQAIAERNLFGVPRLNSPSVPLPPRPYPSIKKGSPWSCYTKAYGIELGGFITRVCKVPETDEMFTLRSFSGSDSQRKLDLLSQLKHNNILTTYELFTQGDEIYVVSEDTEVSLEEFIIARPNEPQLAAIIAQVIKDAIPRRGTELTIARFWTAYSILNRKN
jgi:hypothetical protein